MPPFFLPQWILCPVYPILPIVVARELAYVQPSNKIQEELWPECIVNSPSW
jgi:hypothetical protein